MKSTLNERICWDLTKRVRSCQIKKIMKMHFPFRVILKKEKIARRRNWKRRGFCLDLVAFKFTYDCWIGFNAGFIDEHMLIDGGGNRIRGAHGLF